jgi:hypothetical protein
MLKGIIQEAHIHTTKVEESTGKRNEKLESENEKVTTTGCDSHSFFMFVFGCREE